MALETGNYIGDLVINNPTANDPKSAGDDHLRLIKKVLKECLNGFAGGVLLYGAEGGSADVYTITPGTALVAYVAGQLVLTSPTNTNTGACTLNISSLGAKSIKTALGADPTAGDIAANQPLLLMYDGTNFVILCGSASIQRTGNQTITGTLGVTGAVSLSSTLQALATSITTLTASGGGSFGGAVTGVTAAAGDNTTKFATTAFATALAFAAALPAQPGGSITYTLQSLAGVAFWGLAGVAGVNSQSSNYTVIASDKEKLIDCTGTFALTFTAAATLGNFGFYVRNSGTGNITIPTSDGVTNWLMYPGEARLFFCNGSNFFSIILSAFVIDTATSFTFTKPPVYKAFDLEGWGASGGGGSGRRGAASSTRSGGTGGGGGAYKPRRVLATDVGATETVTIGAAGTGGAAVTTNDTDGNNGTTGGDTSFGSLLISYGGGPGQGGSNGAQAGGNGGGALASNGGGPQDGQASGTDGSRGFGGALGNTASSYPSAFGGGSGGNSTGTGAAGAGGSATEGCPGGGAGGCIDSSDATQAPGAGGSNAGNRGGGAAAGTSGASPTAVAAGTGNQGGGGGGSSRRWLSGPG